MMLIPYFSRKFDPTLSQDFQGQNNLNCTWPEIIWSAITVGKANWAQTIQFGIYSLYERIYKTYLIYANFIQNNNNNIAHSNAFDFLDPSEKGAISYYLGITSAKLMAEKYLNTPWLMHLDVYRNQLNPVFAPRKKAKPDLVGWDVNGNWIVLEGKGRSGRFDNIALNKAKDQVNNLISISGKSPLFKIALECHFQNNILEIIWEDPDKNSKGYKITIDTDMFMHDYYMPFIKVFNIKKHYPIKVYIENNIYKFIVINVDEVDMKIGIIDKIMEKNYSFIKDNYNNFMAYSKDNKKIKIGNDGIYVELGDSWSEDRMKKEPIERNSQHQNNK